MYPTYYMCLATLRSLISHNAWNKSLIYFKIYFKNVCNGTIFICYNDGDNTVGKALKRLKSYRITRWYYFSWSSAILWNGWCRMCLILLSPVYSLWVETSLSLCFFFQLCFYISSQWQTYFIIIFFQQFFSIL